MRGKYEQPKSKGRGVLVAVLIILIVLMIGLLAVVLYGSHLLGLINYSDDGYDAESIGACVWKTTGISCD